MKTARKVLLLVLCAALLVSASVLGTIAYLTDTEEAVNTFSVGHVYIALDEAKVDPVTGQAVEPAERVQKNEYHLLPGHTYVKDPTVTVLANSEESYVRMLVTVKEYNQLTSAMPVDKYPEYYAEYNGTQIFLLEKLVTGWNSETWVFTNFNNGVYEFRHNGTVAKNTGDTALDALFDEIVMPGALTNAQIAKLNELQINVVAHAIQADGFADANAAWTAFDGQNDKDSTPPAAG